MSTYEIFHFLIFLRKIRFPGFVSEGVSRIHFPVMFLGPVIRIVLCRHS